jgi:tetratricopeptide (TPR) repeat protein
MASPAPLVRAPVPPPLPVAAKAGVPAFAGGLEGWARRAFARVRMPSGPYAKLGAALFGAGVLVGVAGAAVVFGGREEPAVEAVAPASLASARPTAVATASAPAQTSEPAAKRPAPVAKGPEPLAKSREVAEDRAAAALAQTTEAPVAKPTQLPISSFVAPTCRQLLGKSITERRDPKRAAVQTTLANRALVRGNVKEAQAAYCLAWAWDRGNVDRRLNLATLYLVRRDWVKAAELGKSALELEPESRRGLSLVGDAWAALHETEKARSALLAAERKAEPSERELTLMVKRDLALAKRVERKRDFALAERLYRRVLLLDPDHAGAMRGVAGCLLKLGDARTAAAWARKAQGLERCGAAARSG